MPEVSATLKSNMAASHSNSSNSWRDKLFIKWSKDSVVGNLVCKQVAAAVEWIICRWMHCNHFALLTVSSLSELKANLFLYLQLQQSYARYEVMTCFWLLVTDFSNIMKNNKVELMQVTEYKTKLVETVTNQSWQPIQLYTSSFSPLTRVSVPCRH